MKIRSEEVTEVIRQQIRKWAGELKVDEVGEVIVELPNGVFGMAMSLEETSVGLVLLGDDRLVGAGDEAKRTGRIVQVPVGDALIGRVVNPLGQQVDSKGDIRTGEFRPVERDDRPVEFLVCNPSLDQPALDSEAQPALGEIEDPVMA